MPLEIERKYLVHLPDVEHLQSGVLIRQGYLATDDHFELRLRLEGDAATLTTKVRQSALTRYETEKSVDPKLMKTVLDLLPSAEIIEKIRYTVVFAGQTWTIDRFFGSNDGLVLAEIELENEHQQVTLPGWVTREVTNDPRYTNASLARAPFAHWHCATRKSPLAAPDDLSAHLN